MGLSFFCYAADSLPPILENVEQRFTENKQIHLACMRGDPSTKKNLGCVDSFKYLNSVCSITKEENYRSRYKRNIRRYVSEACNLYNSSDNKLSYFFELDEKSCVSGYETISDRLISLEKNKQFFDENFSYLYEKRSCKDFRTYVNLCVYVDGQLKNTLPKDYTKLPKVNLAKKPDQVCRSTDVYAGGLNTVNVDMASLAIRPSSNVYDKLITNYRSRMPAGSEATSPTCDEVRNSYNNFGCSRYETIADGDPIYYTEEEFRAIRIREKQLSSSSRGSN